MYTGLRNLILTLALVGLSACSGTLPRYDALLQAWVGHDVDELVTKWGAPDRKIDRADGSRIVGYDLALNTTRYLPSSAYYPVAPFYRPYLGWPSYAGPYGGRSSVYYVTEHCRTDFVVGADRMIKSWQFDGACISRGDRWGPDPSPSNAPESKDKDAKPGEER